MSAGDCAPEVAGTLYEYSLDWSAGSPRRHIDGERSFVERFIPLADFQSLFGGYTLMSDSGGATEFLGVWGRRTISRFKRTLRDRGAVFDVKRGDSGNRRVKRYAQFYQD